LTVGAAKIHETSSADRVVQTILAFLCVAGMSTSELRRAAEGLRERTKSIEELLLTLKYAIQEGITSADMEVYDVELPAKFDPQRMEVAYDDGENNNGDQVLCTVGLGLKKVVTKRVVESTRIDRSEEIMKKPDVVLQSLLEGSKNYCEGYEPDSPHPIDLGL